MSLPHRTIVALVLVGALAAPAAAQPPEPDPLDSMPIRFGPLGLSPSLLIRDVGVDSNVFNDAQNPKEDFTATIVPRVQARLRAGPLLLSASNAAGFVYFHEFADERNVSYTWEARAELTSARLQPYISGSMIETRERLNAELDIRAPRQQTTAIAGARLALASRTALRLEARRSHLTFDDGATFEGVALSRTLNDRVDTYESSLLVTLTPMTTVGVTTGWQRDRFEHAPERDADSFRVMPFVQFDPTALIQGTLGVGYRRFDPIAPVLADYAGLVAQGSLGYTLLERTRFDLRLTRDVHYSFELDQPYYLTTGARLDVIHHLAGPFDVQGGVGRERLGYRQLVTGRVNRTDTADVVSAGVGYRFRDDVRVGVSWEAATRDSDRQDRRYDRHRIVASFSYGI
ncbi:MAG TPA: outer membrane beta-barrel protein [Vicinamibacterales bacterium]|nr:outer membrane beta-barrel protein [Vicinamibacterales bacterium]